MVSISVSTQAHRLTKYRYSVNIDIYTGNVRKVEETLTKCENIYQTNTVRIINKNCCKSNHINMRNYISPSSKFHII